MTAGLVSTIGRRIVAGDIPAGTSLLAQQLGEEYDVSRTVVREALRILQHKGLLAPRQRAGTIVRTARDWSTLDPQLVRWRSDANPARMTEELVQMRRAVEPMAAGLAADRATAAQRAGIARTCDGMLRAFEDDDRGAFDRADEAFHREVVVAAGNAMIAAMADLVAEALLLMHREVAHVDADAVRLHAEVGDAISRGDARRAHTGMVALIAVAEARTRAEGGVP